MPFLDLTHRPKKTPLFWSFSGFFSLNSRPRDLATYSCFCLTTTMLGQNSPHYAIRLTLGKVFYFFSLKINSLRTENSNSPLTALTIVSTQLSALNQFSSRASHVLKSFQPRSIIHENHDINPKNPLAIYLIAGDICL